MDRLLGAWRNSIRAFRQLARSETAFQQELLLLAAAIPAGWVLSTSWRGYALLVGSILLLMIVEVLNTAVEAACNAVSREFHPQIELAKDCGSLAVLLAILLSATVWGMAAIERFAGPTP